MDYEMYNNADEYEPRAIPKPTIKLDCFVVPTVPEVSLVFDKPEEHNNLILSPCNNGDSYATWKKENFSWKSMKSKVSDTPNFSKVQFADSLPNSTHDHGTKKHEKPMVNYNERNEYGQKKIMVDSKKHQESTNSSTNQEYKFASKNYDCVAQNDNETFKKVKGESDSPHLHMIHSNANNWKMCSQLQRKTVQDNKDMLFNSSDHQRMLFNVPNSVPKSALYTQNKAEFQPMHPLQYPYPYFDANSYPFPHLYPPNYPQQNGDNNETVKNLLQLVNTQSEQIRLLQTQVDRLLKMQEESLKDKAKCVCALHMTSQNEQTRIDSYNSPNNPVHSVAKPNKYLKNNANQYVDLEEKSKENIADKKSNQPEATLTEQHTKKTLLEQKVSIGVMTSFEFTVQNNPLLLDCDSREKVEIQHRNEVANMRNGINLHDSSEALPKNKISFTRLPSGQLENIVEDSESYLSSSHQQSSNLNASSSMRDLQRQNHIDMQKNKEVTSNAEDNVIMCPRIPISDSKTNKESSSGKAANKQNLYQYIIGNSKTKPTELMDNAKQQNFGDYRRTGIDTETSNYDQLAATDYKRFEKQNKLSKASDFRENRIQEKLSGDNKQRDCIEDSLVISGADLKVDERPPSPEPSIHVEMHEYSSDDESEKIKRTSKVGWTFYNNVLGQVNQILQNSCAGDTEQKELRCTTDKEQNDTETKAVLDTVKVATLEQLRKLGISLSENPELKEINSNKKVGFDSSFYPRLDCQANMANTGSAITETNTSMHMKALALKYLSDEQLAELAIQKQGTASLQHLMLSNMQGTNMSFATMRYLERYQLLPGKTTAQHEGNGKARTEVPLRDVLETGSPKHKPVVRYPFPQTPRTSCPSKILDISTLKQQPKLL